VLLDAYQLQAEQMIMPDVLFEALAVAALVLLLWAPVPRPWRLAAAAALLGISATVRQIGELLIVPLLGYMLAAAPGWRPRAVRVMTAVTVVALPVAGYMALSAAALGNGFRLSNMDDAYLYGRVAYAADCGTLRIRGTNGRCARRRRRPGRSAWTAWPPTRRRQSSAMCPRPTSGARRRSRGSTRPSSTSSRCGWPET
jgi:hypothetical protein